MNKRLERRLLSTRFAEKATLLSRGPGQYNDYGEFVEGAETQTAISVVSVPLNGEERLVLEEGLRNSESRRFWTTSPVNFVTGEQDATQSDSDLILYKNEFFRVTRVEDWSGGFVEILGVKLEVEDVLTGPQRLLWDDGVLMWGGDTLSW